jgi:imidazolonepropionase-like amidohydrolase
VTTTERPPRQLVALRAAALFDGTRATPIPDPLVLVDEGRIVAVETAARTEPPEGTTVIDLGDATLLPGLIDTHLHLALDAGPEPVASLMNRDDEAVLAGMAAAGRQALRAGITTVRDLGDRSYLAVGLRDADDPQLPTIVTAGPPLTTPGGHCHFMGGATPLDGGAAGLRAAVRERAEHGVDVIKVMASGGFITPGSSGFVPQYDRDQLRTIVDEAHRHGLPVTAHAHSTASIAAALDAGVDGIEHCTFASEAGVDVPLDLIERIGRRRVAIGATVGFRPGTTPPPMVAERMEGMRANLGRLHRAGAPLLAATDAGIGAPKPHDILPYGLEHLAGVGLTNYEVLRAATVEAARVCGLADRKGRIAPGLDADLLAVTGNPLDDLAALHRVVAVYHHGHPVDRTVPEPAR